MAKVTKEEMLRHYTRELQSGDAGLFVGAGLSKPAGFVDWKELMREIAAELELDIEREADLIALAQYHVNERGGRGRINRLLIEEFTRDATLTDNHRLISTLPVHTIWTTNYDELLETAYRESHRRPDVKTTPANLAQTLPQKDVVIYKMHGDCRQPQDAVLTKEDYETYGEKREVFSIALKGDLVERTFLFLGFSFTDPNIDYILTRIRGLLGQNQRSHYCVMKWPDPPTLGGRRTQADYEYEKRKLELRISDLSRYQIHAVMIDSYSEITEILRELNRRSHIKDIFVSGSAHTFAPFGKDRLERFLVKLGKEIIRRGYNLVSGFGRGIGGTVVLGALEEIYEKDLPSKRVALFPFPQMTSFSGSMRALHEKHRKAMISNAGVSIFISGNRANENGEVELAEGVREEFRISSELGKIPIPLGASGWSAAEIWQKVNDDTTRYYGLNSRPRAFEILGEQGHTDDEYLAAIFELIAQSGGRLSS